MTNLSPSDPRNPEFIAAIYGNHLYRWEWLEFEPKFGSSSWKSSKWLTIEEAASHFARNNPKARLIVRDPEDFK